MYYYYLPDLNISDIVGSRLVYRKNGQVTREAAALMDFDHEVVVVTAGDPSVFDIDDAVGEELIGHVRLRQIGVGAAAEYEVCIMTLTVIRRDHLDSFVAAVCWNFAPHLINVIINIHSSTATA